MWVSQRAEEMAWMCFTEGSTRLAAPELQSLSVGTTVRTSWFTASLSKRSWPRVSPGASGINFQNRAAPDVRFWRVDDTIIPVWNTRARFSDGVPCWVETAGQHHFSVASFEREVAGRQTRLTAEVEDRLRKVVALQVLDAQQGAGFQLQHDSSSQGMNGEVREAAAHIEDVSGVRVA